MKITFLGTGEACDISRRNTSILIENDKQHHLLDCGFSSPLGYFAGEPDTPLTTIWISHFHGDHFFGLPQLLVYMYLQKREEQLIILSGMTDCSEKIYSALELAYPGVWDKLLFPLHFLQVKPGEPLQCNGLTWDSAPVSHSQPAFAVKIASPERSLYYGGDGNPTVEAVKLMKGCDLVIHEAFSLTPEKPAHSSVEECLLLADELDIPQLALLHINRRSRRRLREKDPPFRPPAATMLIFPEDNETLAL